MSLKFNSIKNFITFGFVLLLVSCGGGGGGGGLPQEDTSPPVILNKTPDNRVIDVNVIEPIVVTFNEAIDTSATENNVAHLNIKAVIQMTLMKNQRQQIESVSVFQLKIKN